MVQEIGGPATGCALVVIVLLIVFQWASAKTLRNARANTTKMTDVRVRLISEIIAGVRVIKACVGGWWLHIIHASSCFGSFVWSSSSSLLLLLLLLLWLLLVVVVHSPPQHS